MIGIYIFTNKINGKSYIGQSINIQDRKKQHFYRYKNEKDNGYNSAIHSAFRKYGWENFSFEVLEECSLEELDAKEIYWISKKNTLVPNGYNILSGGQKNRCLSNKHYCPICGNEKTKDAKHCLKCESVIREEKSLINKEEIDFSLILKILDSSLEEVAKEYGYSSGNGLKKQLLKYGYPATKVELFKYYEEKVGKKHPKNMKEITKQKNKEKNKPHKIGQYSLNGELIKIYNSSHQAKEDGFSSGHIVECCNGKRKKYRDFIWKYLS